MLSNLMGRLLKSHRKMIPPLGHTDRFVLLINLANQLSTRFDHRGNAEDLSQANTLQSEALALHSGNAKDLDEAIVLDREALALCSAGQTARSASLVDLALLLSARFDHRRNPEDLDEAIALHREALALCPVSHTHRPKSLYNLSARLFTRFNHQTNAEDLNEAIALSREVLALCTVGHTLRSSSSHNLAVRLFTHFDHRGNAEDPYESREYLRRVLTLLAQRDVARLKAHASLTLVYLSFDLSGLDSTSLGEDTGSLNAAMHHFKAAANVIAGGLLRRLRASLLWAHHASQHSHSTELEAYATSMQLLDAHMSAKASVSSRHSAMKDFPRALRTGDTRRAVELLEQGRTIHHMDPDDRTPHASRQLPDLRRSCSDSDEEFQRPQLHPRLTPASDVDGMSRVHVDAEATRYRRVVREEWDGVVDEIRKIKGFSCFLLPPLFSDLEDAARDGSIIVLIASQSSCDAIIIPPKQPPIKAVEKEAGPKGNQTALTKALRKSWDDVVRPMVKNLGGFAPRGSQIWWVNGESLSQQYISSYTPSLTALMRARRSHDRCHSLPFAAIGQTLPDGASFTMDGVEPELESVRRLLPPPPTVSFTKITSVDATKLRALRALRDNTWLHFARHGTQNYDDPFNSAFLMRDQPLSLLDITQMDISQHVGDFATPDEVIHLAAGLQSAGIKSVVGTLGKVDDSTVQRLVKACGDGKMNHKRAARALHQAVHSLARDKDMPLDQRIVFIHFGV
ncbi:CHAT domain-containing protein [Suillus occidentalis]|nr:CHAT domain-containing protein [Suillus occidentalis]